MIEEYMPHNSLTHFVKKIPDELMQKPTDLGLNAKAAIFIQKATLAAMNKISKVHFIDKFKAKHPTLCTKMVDAYNKMILCFAESQDILIGQSFSVFYDENTMEIKDSAVGKMAKISYFSDFIFMQ